VSSQPSGLGRECELEERRYGRPDDPAECTHDTTGRRSDRVCGDGFESDDPRDLLEAPMRVDGAVREVAVGIVAEERRDGIGDLHHPGSSGPQATRDRVCEREDRVVLEVLEQIDTRDRIPGGRRAVEELDGVILVHVGSSSTCSSNLLGAAIDADAETDASPRSLAQECTVAAAEVEQVQRAVSIDVIEYGEPWSAAAPDVDMVRRVGGIQLVLGPLRRPHAGSVVGNSKTTAELTVASRQVRVCCGATTVGPPERARVQVDEAHAGRHRGMEQQVPRMVHLVWLGSAVPAQVERLRADISRHSPDVEVRIWTDDALPALKNLPFFLEESRMPAKADLARIEILLAHGGLYLDADFRVHRPLEPIFAAIDTHGLVVARQSPTVYNNAFIGARQGHPVLEALVDDIPATYRWTGRMSAPATTGPHYITEHLMAYLRDGGTFHELPQHAVFPWYSDEDPLPSSLLPPSVVMSHEWAMASRGWAWGRIEDDATAVPVPDRRSRQRRAGGSIRARAAVTPSAHAAIARAERLLASASRWEDRSLPSSAELGATDVHIERWSARLAARTLRGSAVFLDLQPRSLLPLAAAARVLDRPGRAIAVLDPESRLRLPVDGTATSTRCSTYVATTSGDADRIVGIASRGTPLLARTVTSANPPLGTCEQVEIATARLVTGIPRFDLVRSSAEALTVELAGALEEMTRARRIARLVIRIDPYSTSIGVGLAASVLEELESSGLTITVRPWLLEGRDRTWREHLRVAARPFLAVVA